MSFCANCGRQRSGTAQFCGACGAEFNDATSGAAEPADLTEPAAPTEPAPGEPGAAPGERAAPVDATRMDAMPRATRIDSPAARPDQPDPFASWFQQDQPAAPDWHQPTQTVRPTPPPQPQGYQPQGYQPQGYQPEGYQATEYLAPGHPTAGYGPSPYGPGTPPGPPYQPARPAPKRRGPGLLIVLAIVIVLAAGGGAYALATSLGKHTTTQPPASPTAHASTPPASGPATSSPSASLSPSASPTASASASQSLVAVSPGVSGSAVPQVEAVLSRRFQAINTHNYNEYASTLTSAALASQSQSVFDKGYATTKDSGMTLTALSTAGSELAATVTFTSQQDPSNSVDGSSCNTWTLTLYLAPNGTGYLVDKSPSGAPAAKHGDC